MHVLLLADGAVANRAALDEAWPGWDADVGQVIAADGGARHAGPLGVRLDRWVGDGDSLGADGVAALRDAGLDVRTAPVDKDESDTELAVAAALDAGATRLTVLGALGGPRIDHALANIGLLGLPALKGIDTRLVADDARVRLLDAAGRTAMATLEGRPGDLVSLFPVGDDAHGVTTAGLRYPLVGETLEVGRTRGLSNVRVDAVATITLERGRLLIVESPARLSA